MRPNPLMPTGMSAALSVIENAILRHRVGWFGAPGLRLGQTGLERRGSASFGLFRPILSFSSNRIRIPRGKRLGKAAHQRFARPIGRPYYPPVVPKTQFLSASIDVTAVIHQDDVRKCREEGWCAVENLFDEDYEQIFSFTNPGIGAFAGIRARF